MNQDMTKDNVFKALLRFTVPLIISGLLQQLYYIVDSIIVGNLLGENALAAVGVSAPVTNVFIYIIIGLVSGYTILVSQYFGAKEYQKISRLSSSFFLFTIAAACIISIAGYAMKEELLVMLNTPEELLEASGLYLSIVFMGIPAVILYNLCASMLRGIGDSKTPLYAILLSTIINVVLDLVFIKIIPWGIKGVAVATVIAQIISGIYLMVHIHRQHPMLRLSFKRDYLDISLFIESIKLGAPRVVQSSVASVGSLMLQNIMNSFGVDVVTAITTAYKIDTLTILPIINISTAISIFVGQNIGANSMERAREGLRKGILIILAVSVVITSIFVLFGAELMKLFGVSDEIALLGQRFFTTMAVFYPVLGLENAFVGFLQGNKDVTFTAASNMLCLAIRVFLSFALASRLGFDIIAISEVSSWVLGAAIAYGRYKSNRWQKFSLTAAPIPNDCN